jgi:predicted Zn-dependent protease
MGMMGKSHYHTGVLSFLEGNPKNARYHLKEAQEKLKSDDPLRAKIKELIDTIKQLEKM